MAGNYKEWPNVIALTIKRSDPRDIRLLKRIEALKKHLCIRSNVGVIRAVIDDAYERMVATKKRTRKL